MVKHSTLLCEKSSKESLSIDFYMGKETELVVFKSSDYKLLYGKKGPRGNEDSVVFYMEGKRWNG